MSREVSVRVVGKHHSCGGGDIEEVVELIDGQQQVMVSCRQCEATWDDYHPPKLAPADPDPPAFENLKEFMARRGVCS